MSISEKLATIAENEQKVYQSGTENGKNEMINVAFSNGTKTEFTHFFARTNWDTVEFPEEFVLYPKAADKMFYAYKGSKIPKIFDFCNIPNNGSYITQLCQWASSITEFPDLNIPVYGWYHDTFGYCRSLKKIEILRVMNTTIFKDTFLECNVLEDITFEGIIGTNLDMSSCKKLSVASLRNIISCLETKTSGTFTLNIGGENIAKLTEEDINTIEAKGWNYQ